MKIGDKIKEIREKEKNLTQLYVAEQLGIKPRAYSNIENNVADISFTKLEKLATVFEVPIAYIINYKENSGNYYNNFYNQNGNNGINIKHQGQDIETVHSMYAQILNLKDEIIKSKEIIIEEYKNIFTRNK